MIESSERSMAHLDIHFSLSYHLFAQHAGGPLLEFLMRLSNIL